MRRGMGKFGGLVLLAAMLLLAPCCAQAAYTSRVIDAAPTDEALARVAPVLRGKTFALYDERSEIEVIKMRLQALGYYRRMATFDDVFNQTMRTCVTSFQRNNQLEETGRADEATLAALYGENPVKGKWYEGSEAEPQRALIFPVTGSLHLYKRAQEAGGLRVTVRNVSLKKTITAYEISLYTADAQGNVLHEIPSLVMSGNIAPGESKWTDDVILDHPDGIAAVHVALKRVRFSDGTYEIYSDPAFDCWALM